LVLLSLVVIALIVGKEVVPSSAMFREVHFAFFSASDGTLSSLSGLIPAEGHQRVTMMHFRSTKTLWTSFSIHLRATSSVFHFKFLGYTLNLFKRALFCPWWSSLAESVVEISGSSTFLSTTISIKIIRVLQRGFIIDFDCLT